MKDAHSATEVKYAAKGRKITAIIGYAAVVINYTPENSDLDKTLAFATCLHGETESAHTLELLPDDVLAVATTGQSQKAGV